MPDAQTETVVALERQEDADSPGDSAPEPVAEDCLVEADLLIEDVSIDGMCGVY
jgi:mycofactocin precursor